MGGSAPINRCSTEAGPQQGVTGFRYGLGMPYNVRAQITLRTSDLIPANYSTNTLHLLVQDSVTQEDDPEGIGFIIEDITQLYLDLEGVLGSLSRDGHEIALYDERNPLDSPPIRIETFDFVSFFPPDRLPSEVSIVSSFRAQRQPGVSPRSTRNRVYIGPLRSAALDETTGRVADASRQLIAQAFFDFLQAVADRLDVYNWVIRSPTLGLSWPIFEGFVDNAFDTQRRRGVESSARSTWNRASLTGPNTDGI
uniref:Uncharacterized protein n=1 Tax=uncultured prokaryote TaxID=198431 RepID=A0A0H5Q3P0_9ZZZZ|nr:hypothetical protein [uncultured prokaryote]